MAWYNPFSWHRKPAPTPTPAPIPTPVPVSSGKIFGVATASFSEVADFNAKTGKPVNTFTIYPSFYYDPNFPTARVKEISDAGITPLVVWEPYNPDLGVVQPDYSLKTINSGKYDTMIKNWASQIKAYGKPILLSFGPEMNGDWNPWSGGVNGNTQADYVAAFQRVVLMFRAAGVTNVKFVCQFNEGSNLKPFYPGDNYVDLVAVDGYNWDTSSPEQVFGSTFDLIKTFTSKPIYIGETGCPEYSGKPKWIADFFVMMKNRDLLGFNWFNFNKENNWRIDSSPAAQAAFKAGVSTF